MAAACALARRVVGNIRAVSTQMHTTAPPLDLGLPIVPVRSMTGVAEPVIRIEDGLHPLEAAFAPEIDANWLAETDRNPQLFDGQLLLLTGLQVDGARLLASVRRARYATYVFCLRNRVDRLYCLYAHAVLVTTDNALIAVEMAAHTLNAGSIYFACGAFDGADTRDGFLKLGLNMEREVREETGLAIGSLRREPLCQALTFENGTMVAQRYDIAMSAQEAEARVRAFIANDPEAEIVRPVVIRNAGFQEARMAMQMPAIIEWHFREPPRFANT